jgi:hypothetical protein
LDQQFPGRWIGHGGPTPWPALSPDITHLYVFLWAHLKSFIYIYDKKPVNIPELKQMPSDEIHAIISLLKNVMNQISQHLHNWRQVKV